MSHWLFKSGGQSIRASASASALSMKIQGWFPLALTTLISLQSKGLSRVLSSTIVWKLLILWRSAFFMVQFSHPNKTTGKTIALTIWTLDSKVMSLVFNTVPRFVIAFLPRSKCLNLMAAVTVISNFGTQENKICHCFHFFPFYLP